MFENDLPKLNKTNQKKNMCSLYYDVLLKFIMRMFIYPERFSKCIPDGFSGLTLTLENTHRWRPSVCHLIPAVCFVMGKLASSLSLHYMNVIWVPGQNNKQISVDISFLSITSTQLFCCFRLVLFCPVGLQKID